MDRRGFLRVALFGAAGAATVAACPQFVEDLITRKSYFFMKYRQPGITTLAMEDLNAITAKFIVPKMHDIVYRRSLLFVRVKRDENAARNILGLGRSLAVCIPQKD